MTYGELKKRLDRRLIVAMSFAGLVSIIFLGFMLYGLSTGNEPENGFAMLFLALVFYGAFVLIPLDVYNQRKLRPIHEAWEKQFDDLFFLLSHSGLHPTHWETVRLLWTGPASSTPKTSSPVTMPLTDQLLFEAYASDRDSFDRRLLETIGAGVIDARDGKFFISQRVFEAARQAYPLDDFPFPEPPKLSALNIGLSE